MGNTSSHILYKLAIHIQIGDLIAIYFPLALLGMELIKQDYDKTTELQNKETGRKFPLTVSHSRGLYMEILFGLIRNKSRPCLCVY